MDPSESQERPTLHGLHICKPDRWQYKSRDECPLRENLDIQGFPLIFVAQGLLVICDVTLF